MGAVSKRGAGATCDLSVCLVVAVALSLSLGCSARVQGSGATHSPGEAAAEAAPEGVSGEWLAHARQGLAEREYRASRNRLGLQAPNRAHNLRTYFEPTGVRVHDRTAAGSPELLALSLAGVGRGDALTAPEPGAVSSQGARVEIRRGTTLLEWYENSPAGLEQGFTLAERPAGEGPLAIELAVGGASASLREAAVVFATATGRRLRYGELRASDAAGKELVARLSLTSGARVRLEVEDAGAAYPLVVDPLLTEASDTQLESDQAGAYLGYSVAEAGDVNGDGHGDVIVGALYYDAGQTDEGAAFVFLGTASGIADGDPGTAHAQLESDQASAYLGNSVAGAGDVNGDGYADVIVGAPYYDASENNEGAAFVFLGSASGIADGNPAAAHAQLESDQASAYLGNSVAGAGDVNGDGYTDVIAGAYHYDAGETNEGAAFVFLGSDEGIVAAGNPTNADAQLEADQGGAYLGWSVAGAGDVNGDGYADVIVGAYWYAAGETDEGAAFVFLGSDEGIVAAGNPANADAQLESDQGGACLGWSVAGAGDVNGDGYADVIVGAFQYDAGETDEGAAFVFLGSDEGIVAAGNPTNADAQLESDQANAWLGYPVAGAGDVNGDGYADVIVGAPYYESIELGLGAAFVFLGSDEGIVAAGNPANADARLESDQVDGVLGYSVTGAGDVNGDGYADVIVGAPVYDAGETDEGAAFVFLGSSAGIEDGNPATAQAQLESDQAEGALGTSAAGAGDVNGDGYADAIVGAPTYDAGETDEGAAFVFLGSASGIADGARSTAHAQLEADQAGAKLGTSVAGAGDVNGDGYADVIVGAPTYDAGDTDEGAAFVFLGSASGIANGDPGTAYAQLEADQAGAKLGSSVAGAGSVNGDGYADVIVGAPYYDAGETDEGAAFVFLGSAVWIANGDPGTADAQLEPDQAGAKLGASVAGAGNVNGDGYADVIVGAPYYDAGETDEGAAFLFLGSASGITDGNPTTAHAQLESDQAEAKLGTSVAGAGDVNGDGYADVIAGAESYDAGETNEGAAFVFLGSASGIADGNPATAHAQLESDQAEAKLGTSVAGAGDIDGDGYADVIVGADQYDAGETDEGAAFIFVGSAEGIADGDPATAHAQLESDQAEAKLGTSVAGAGDVNGDGCAEIIVGAYQYDAGETNEGAAFVFLRNSGGNGRPALAQQLRGDASGVAVQPWGGSLDEDAFQVEMTATHPKGRGRVKLEVEACPAGAAFGDVSCASHVGAIWTDVTATPDGVRLTETLTGLTADTLYRWRSRVLYAPFTSATPPPNPAHGPWRRLQAQAVEADIRVVPEPGEWLLVFSGLAGLRALGRRREEWRR